MSAWATRHLARTSAESSSRFLAIQKSPGRLSDHMELRGALLDFLADFASWDNSVLPEFLATARALTQVAHESLGGVAGTKPLVVDPFAGGGSIPLEALRVGADAFASDLNPLPILLNTVTLEYVAKYGQRLAEQVKESAARLRCAAERDLRESYFTEGKEEKRLVFFWGRTIDCEGPGCGYRFPLLRSLWLRRKPTRGVAFALKHSPKSKEVVVEVLNEVSVNSVGSGTSKQGAATCPVCGYTTRVERVRLQLAERRGGAADAKLLAVGSSKTGETGKFYRAPTSDEIRCFEKARTDYQRLRGEIVDGIHTIPNEPLNHLRGFFNVVLYGMTTWGDLFNPRQALLMVRLTQLIKQEHKALAENDAGFADAVATCLALLVGKVAQYNSSCCRWKPTGETLVDMFGRQAIPMVWDFAEAYPFSQSTGDLSQYAESFCAVLENVARAIVGSGTVRQSSATKHPLPDDIAEAFITDPPYYDAIPYADLSDFFYVWFRRMLKGVYPDLLREPLSPKDDEAVTLSHRAAMYRHKDRQFFERMMTAATTEGRRYTKPSGIGVVVFANKSTSGWEAMLSALIESGWIVTASWPIDTEMSSRLRAQDSAVLGSSVHLVCRPRENFDGSIVVAEIGDWRDVLQELPQRIHQWMPHLAEEGIVGADAIFACLGPALEIFSRYSRVERSNGEVVLLREYLEHVWAGVSNEALSMIFKDADAAGLEPDARLTAMWLWTVSSGSTAGPNGAEAEVEEEDNGDEGGSKGKPMAGVVLEFDAARKIAQGLGIHLEKSPTIVEIKGDQARLLPVAERASFLFGKETPDGAAKRKPKVKNAQLALFEVFADFGGGETEPPSDLKTPDAGSSVLDRVHQAMILFAAGRAEALKRFLVEDGIGKDARFWKLAQSLSALYPTTLDEKRWVDGVLARKKALGF
jgi:putative DNA methylase